MPISPKELVLAFLGGVGCFAALVGWDALGVGSFNCPQRENFMLEVFCRLEYNESKKGGVCSLFVWIFLFDFNGVKPCFGVDYFLRLGCFVLKDNQFLGRKCWCVLKLRSLT